MLKLKNLIENDEIATRLLDDYNLNDYNFGFCRSSSNVVYWVENDSKIYFLRYTTLDERTKDELIAEVNFINYLNSNGINANKPLMSKNGAYVVQKDNYIAVLFERVFKKSLDDIKMDYDMARRWGEELGKIHNLSKDYQVIDDIKRKNHKDKFDWINNILKLTDDKEILDCCNNIEIEFKKKNISNNHYGLCHYDFELDNVFYNPSTNKLSIIDFDDSMYNFFFVDFTHVMMNIDEEISSELQETIKEGFNAGYSKYMELPKDDEINLARRFINILGYAEASYSLLYEPKDKPDWMSEVINDLTAKKEKMRFMLLRSK